MSTVLKQFKRCFSNDEVRLRIGTAIRTIPEEYKTFFTGKKALTESLYDPKLKLILHLNGTVLMPPPSSTNPTDEKVLLVEGVKEVEKFLCRLRILMKWGHFYWRLSDLSALRLEPQRVIKPEAVEGQDIEMKIHWQMKVDGDDAFFINDKINLKSLYQVQYQRFFPVESSQKLGLILYTGISRYVFSGTSGFCKEFHVERIEPKMSKSKMEWKWRIAAN